VWLRLRVEYGIRLGGTTGDFGKVLNFSKAIYDAQEFIIALESNLASLQGFVNGNADSLSL
jgi:hypothetical protein